MRRAGTWHARVLSSIEMNWTLARGVAWGQKTQSDILNQLSEKPSDYRVFLVDGTMCHRTTAFVPHSETKHAKVSKKKRCSHNEENPERQQKSSRGSSMRANESEIAQKPDAY